MHKRGPDCRGLAIDEGGVAFGPHTLIHRTPLGYRTVDESQLAETLRATFGNGRDAPWLADRLASIARALQGGELAKAQLLGLYLKLPALDDTQLERLASATTLRKGFDPDEPRVPSGSGRASGQWTRDGGDVAESSGEETRPDTKADDWVSLPDGERIDELGDLLEWIANAKPEDAPQIRAEIKRLYYDVGDVRGGDALNRALSDALQPGATRRDREAILEDYEPYTRADPAEMAEFGRDLTATALLGTSGRVSPSSDTAAVEPWKLGWAARGNYFDEKLGRNLSHGFPTIDAFEEGIAISNKSIDLNAATYQDGTRLGRRLDIYINKVAGFNGDGLGGDVVKAAEIKGRALRLAIPQNVTTEQRTALEAAKARAKRLGVNLIVVAF